MPGSNIFSKNGTTQNFSGGSADAALRAWLLAVALHQDDLPPPPVRLPAHQDVPDAAADRAEVLAGAGRDTPLTGAAPSQEGAHL